MDYSPGVLRLPLRRAHKPTSRLTATSSTSYVSSWETIVALNDGFTAWQLERQITWRLWQLEQSELNPMGTVRLDTELRRHYYSVYWFNDGGGVLTPTTATAQYWNGTAWVSLGAVP